MKVRRGESPLATASTVRSYGTERMHGRNAAQRAQAAYCCLLLPETAITARQYGRSEAAFLFMHQHTMTRPSAERATANRVGARAQPL